MAGWLQSLLGAVTAAACCVCQDLAWERYYDLKPSELGDLIRMPKYGKALVSWSRSL